MSQITQFTPTYKLIDKTKNGVVPITIEGDTTGNLLPYRSSCRISDVVGKAGTYNATLVLRSDDNLFIDHGPILVDEFAKFKYLIDIQFFQPKDIGGGGQDNLGFKSRFFRCEISNATTDTGRKGHHISLELTAYDIRLEETLDAERHELLTPKQSFIDRIINTVTRTILVPVAATGLAVLSGLTVLSITVLTGSNGHQFPPDVSIAAPPGFGTATATAVLGTGGNSDKINSFTVTSQDGAYTSPPVVTIDPPTGPEPRIQATGIAVLGTGGNAGKVISITLTNPGDGYPVIPNVSIAPPTSAATATANIINGIVTSFTITNIGDFYTSIPTVTVDAPPRGPIFSISDTGETTIDLPDDERLKQDWIPTKPTPVKSLLDEIIDKVSKPEILGSANQDFYHFTVAIPQAPQNFIVTAKQFGEIDSGVILKDSDITTENERIEKTKQSDFNNRKYKNIVIGRGKSGSQTFPPEFGRLSSDLNHARFASDYAPSTTYLEGDYVKSGFDRFKSLADNNMGNTPAASPFAWENLSSSTGGTPWTIDPEIWIASLAGFNLNKISGGSGTGAIIRAVVANGAVIGSRIESGGINYVNGESLTVSGTGTGATATAIVSGGVITGITITAGGINWFVGFATDMNITRGNYDRDDEFDEFEKVSVKDIEAFSFSDPDDITDQNEISDSRRWIVNGGTGAWAGQNQKIAQYDKTVSPAVWRFSNAPVGVAAGGPPTKPTSFTTRDIVNNLELGRVLGFNGANWETIWDIINFPANSSGITSPFHPVETIAKVANRIGLNQAVEFTYNWNTFDLASITQIILDGIKISLPVGVPLNLFGVDLSSITSSTSTATFLTLIGKTDQQLLDAFGLGNIRNHASRCLMWNLKLPLTRKKIKTSVKQYQVGEFINKPLLDFENLTETIDKNLKGWNNGLDTENLGNLRGLELWQRTSFFNKAGQPLNGLSDLPFLLFFRDKFDTLVYKEITQRSHNRWGKFRVAAGPNTGFKIFDSRIDELFKIWGYTFPDNFFIEQRELTGVKFDWRRVKEIMCIYKGSYDDNFFYKAGQNAFYDTFVEHTTQFFKDLAVRFTLSSVTGILDEEEVIIDKAKIAVDDIHFIKDAYISSSDIAEPDSRASLVDLQNQSDYINMKKTLLPRLLSRKQFHPEFQITDCIGDVRLRAGQSYTLDDSTVSTPTKLTPIEVIHIDDGNGYNCQLTSIRKYEVPT